jgi:hypothetical protein
MYSIIQYVSINCLLKYQLQSIIHKIMLHSLTIFPDRLRKGHPTFLWQGGTHVIVGWFTGHTRKIKLSSGSNRLNQWFPTFFHLHTPWQPISINFTHYVSSATRHNVHLISHLLTCILSYTVDICASFCHYSVFFTYP